MSLRCVDGTGIGRGLLMPIEVILHHHHLRLGLNHLMVRCSHVHTELPLFEVPQGEKAAPNKCRLGGKIRERGRVIGTCEVDEIIRTEFSIAL